MGLFDKKKETQFELPAKLEMLLQLAVEDGEVTEKELAVLRAEAQKHEISEDELDMIITSRLPKQSKLDNSSAKSKISSEEVNQIIETNMYTHGDSITLTFQKYEVLCDYSNKKIEKCDSDKLHRAKLTYISSIESPSDKEIMLDLIAHALPYAKKDLSSKAS